MQYEIMNAARVELANEINAERNATNESGLDRSPVTVFSFDHVDLDLSQGDYEAGEVRSLQSIEFS